jgi:uncharacterized protein (DUF1697 family)
MPIVISMLRGVNVGGHNKIKMDALRALYESLKFTGCQTFIQSGNVIFKTKERNLAKLSSQIQTAIERSFGFRPDVILRTSEELRDVVARNPFAKRRGIEPGKLLVTFLASAPTAQARDNLLKLKTNGEELRIDGRELYTYFPDGMGRSKIWPLIERTLKVSGTGRNWNSVTKMLAIADALAADTEAASPAKR